MELVLAVVGALVGLLLAAACGARRWVVVWFVLGSAAVCAALGLLVDVVYG